MIPFIQANATPIVGFLTIMSNIIFVVLLVAILTHAGSRAHIRGFVHRNVLRLLFWATLSAVVGSLAYSEIVGFPACDLCWIQRMFMYPQAVLLLIAMQKNDRGIVDYLLPLSIIGGLVALYHTFVQWGWNTPTLACTGAGGACAKVYVLAYGYVTIPFMSLTVFAFLIAITFVYYHAKKYHD